MTGETARDFMKGQTQSLLGNEQSTVSGDTLSLTHRRSSYFINQRLPLRARNVTRFV